MCTSLPTEDSKHTNVGFILFYFIQKDIFNSMSREAALWRYAGFYLVKRESWEVLSAHCLERALNEQ